MVTASPITRCRKCPCCTRGSATRRRLLVVGWSPAGASADGIAATLGEGTQLLQCERPSPAGFRDLDSGPDAFCARGLHRLPGAQPAPRTPSTDRFGGLATASRRGTRHPPIRVLGALADDLIDGDAVGPTVLNAMAV